jgi:ribonuclease D
MKDEAVIDVAVSAPRSAEALGRLRSIPNGFERSRSAADILEAVERGLARDPATVPVPARSRQRAGGGAVVELLKVLLKAVAEQERVAPKVIATVDDLEAIAEHNDADVAALVGWRRKLFGEKALDLKAGRLGLSVNGGRIVVQPLEQGPSD